jgi:hypothetical protein
MRTSSERFDLSGSASRNATRARSTGATAHSGSGSCQRNRRNTSATFLAGQEWRLVRLVAGNASAAEDDWKQQVLEYEYFQDRPRRRPVAPRAVPDGSQRARRMIGVVPSTAFTRRGCSRRRPAKSSSRAEPKVCRLTAGGEWIRKFSSAMPRHHQQRGRPHFGGE